MLERLDTMEGLIAERPDWTGVLYISLSPEARQASISIDPDVLERLGQLSVHLHADAFRAELQEDPAVTLLPPNRVSPRRQVASDLLADSRRRDVRLRLLPPEAYAPD